MAAPMSAALILRARTAARHDEVDAAYAAFALDDASGYRAFLLAHARALPAAEAALASTPQLPEWRPRTPLLADDLATLGLPLPPPLPFAVTGAAFAWGVLYVVEGSRLGGAMLARQVDPGLPRRYLDATFAAGEWRSLRIALDTQAQRHGFDWIEDAVRGAEACFALYRRAAAFSEDSPRSAR